MTTDRSTNRGVLLGGIICLRSAVIAPSLAAVCWLWPAVISAADTMYVGNTGSTTIRTYNPVTGVAGSNFITTRSPIQISIFGGVLYYTTGRGDKYGQINLGTGAAIEEASNSPNGFVNTAGANWGLDHDADGKVFMSLDRAGDGRGFIRYAGPGDDITVQAYTTPVNTPNSSGSGLGDVQVVGADVYWGDGDNDGGANGVPFEIYKIPANFGNVTETTFLDNNNFTEDLREFGGLAVSGNTLFFTARENSGNWKMFIYDMVSTTYSVVDPDNGRLWDVDVFKNEVYLGTDSGIKVYSLAGVFNRTLAPGVPAHSLTFVAAPPPIQILITSVSYDANQDRLTVKWSSTPGATYTLENSQQFVGDGAGTSWDNLTTGIASGGSTTTRVIDAPQPGTYFRIRKE